jgi:hypothetical protein
MIELTFRRKPLDPAYTPLPTIKFPSRAYLNWSADRLNPVIAGILRDSVDSYQMVIRANLWLLFPTDFTLPLNLEESLDELAGLQGYLLIDEHGSHAEAGFLDEKLTGDWFGAIRALAKARL